MEFMVNPKIMVFRSKLLDYAMELIFIRHWPESYSWWSLLLDGIFPIFIENDFTSNFKLLLKKKKRSFARLQKYLLFLSQREFFCSKRVEISMRMMLVCINTELSSSREFIELHNWQVNKIINSRQKSFWNIRI